MLIHFCLSVLESAWALMLQSSTYVLFGLLVSGLLRIFLSPASVARHFGNSRVGSVFKAALLGIPIPLCSCGVLPAAVSLKKQGANSGATTAFLISTPESGVDSIAISYALIGPVMALARPVAAFLTAVSAGLLENLVHWRPMEAGKPDLSCTVDACCNGMDCDPEEHKRHHSLPEKIRAGLRYSFTDVWGDLAAWFLLGLLLAGLVTALVPERIFTGYLAGGLPSMLLMLAVGIPLYICATASTPIAAALILKGVSPGAALVFLLAGPATNIASLTVLTGTLGKRTAAIYLGTIAVFSVLMGLALDKVYTFLGVSPKAAVGKAAEIIPEWLALGGALLLLALSIKPVYQTFAHRLIRSGKARTTADQDPQACDMPQPYAAGG